MLARDGRGGREGRCNAQAVEWARRSKIVIHARKTADPVGGGRETVARATKARSRARTTRTENVRAIVGIATSCMARVASASLPLFLSTAAAERAHCRRRHAAGEDAFVHLPLLNVPDWARCARGREGLGGAATFLGNAPWSSVVGYGLTGASGALDGVFECSRRRGDGRAR